MEQRSDEWRAARLGKITGTRAAQATGSASVQLTLTCAMVREYATASTKIIPQNAAMLKGIDDEDLACAAYTMDTGNEVEHAGLLISKDNQRFGMSPDGLIGDDGGLEIKNLNEENHIRVIVTDKPDKAHVTQCHWGMLVTGRAWWDLWYYSKEMPPALASKRFHIERDDSVMKELSEKAEKFLVKLDETLEKLGLAL